MHITYLNTIGPTCIVSTEVHDTHNNADNALFCYFETILLKNVISLLQLFFILVLLGERINTATNATSLTDIRVNVWGFPVEV